MGVTYMWKVFHQMIPPPPPPLHTHTSFTDSPTESLDKTLTCQKHATKATLFPPWRHSKCSFAKQLLENEPLHTANLVQKD